LSAPLLFVSSNAGKAREVEDLLGLPIALLDLDLPEIQALDVEGVVRQKALGAYAATGQRVLVEDTGLYLDALNGLPGALVRWFLLTIGPAGICGLIPAGATRVATARSAVALCEGGTVEIFTGETRGEITALPAGSGGFGWDPIFRPAAAARTFAEMEPWEKHRYSMRRRALDQLRERV
jgi:non-canonical purine NTP pyrophosphatase (RdgB/HAM1 family)